jgi:predicted AAA+ superfamily ATPase
MIPRAVEKDFSDSFFKGKVLVLYGPRQTGKTTLVQKVLEDKGEDYLWLSGDEADVRQILTDTNRTSLAGIFGKHRIAVIDEAQRIRNIGLTLKIAADFFPDIQVIATGSSSFELANEINEPLTGRKKQFTLYPVSFSEMAGHDSLLEEKRRIERRLRFGSYPEIVSSPGEEVELLQDLAESYLYKDILSFNKLRKPEVLNKLLRALALQLGSEVKYAELAGLLGIDNETVERYIDLLEKAFVIFRLPSFTRNMRNEIKKGRKIYFYDTGMRNYIINNFNPMDMRTDTGGLWENWLILERMKMLHYKRIRVNSYFWRTLSQQEIDYIEEGGGGLEAWAFTWTGKGKERFPQSFLQAYPGIKASIVDRNNFEGFVL